MIYRVLKTYSLYLAWLIALAATLISLYTSFFLGIPVCDLCWYQRICIYPLAILLGIAAYHDDRSIIKYAVPLSTLGFLFSLYQYLEQMVPNFFPISLCSPTSPNCSEVYIKLLGFITIPFLSMLATLLMTSLLIIRFYVRK